ncbi:hypothetical protein AB5I41_03855 [Sphingomonas sp. MMS24-JH45]
MAARANGACAIACRLIGPWHATTAAQLARSGAILPGAADPRVRRARRRLDPAAAAFLAERLANSRLFEYGSGGSTLAADRAGVPTLWVEGDRFYARSVARRLSCGTRVTMPVDMG